MACEVKFSSSRSDYWGGVVFEASRSDRCGRLLFLRRQENQAGCLVFYFTVSGPVGHFNAERPVWDHPLDGIVGPGKRGVEPASFVGLTRKDRVWQVLELAWFCVSRNSTTKDSAPPATRGERVLEGSLIRGGAVHQGALAKAALQETATFLSVAMPYKLTTPATDDLDSWCADISPCGN